MKQSRQSMKVTTNELRILADRLDNEMKELNEDLGFDFEKLGETKHLIVIINKTPKCSDTWELDTIDIK